MKTISQVVATALDIRESQVTEDLELYAIPEWSSLGHVELMLALEEAYGLEIDEDRVLQLTSVASIRSFLDEKNDRVDPLLIGQSTAFEQDSNRKRTRIERGLKRVFFDVSEVTHIDVRNQDILYRGYSLHELVEKSSFEETAYLLLHGDLPSLSELKHFDDTLREARSISSRSISFIEQLTDLAPLHALRTVVSAWPTLEQVDRSSDAILPEGIRIIAKLPTIIACHHRVRSRLRFIEPDMSLSHSANFLYMLTGARHADRRVRLLERDLILHADHSSTPSTFAARLAAGAEADVFAALTAAFAVLGGDLHGNAPENVVRALHEIKQPEDAVQFVRQKRENNEPIMGFGHRIYKTEDPRVRHLRRFAQELSIEVQRQDLFAIAEALVEAMKPYARHGVNINDDYYSSIIFHLLDVPHDLLGSIAASSRVVGLVTHIVEQYDNNVMMAPSLRYVGRGLTSYVPLDER